MKHFSLFSLFSLLFLSPHAADYYWGGGSGNWSDIDHWRTSSGGAVKHSVVPSIFDNVFFDANSGFTSADSVVTINVIATCHSMDWTGAQHHPVLASYWSGFLNIYGSLTLIPAMAFYPGAVYFEATSPGKTITSAGHHFGIGPYFGQNNIGGGWTLLDSLWGSNINLSSGALNTNGHKVIASHFSVGFGATGLDLETSLMKVDFWSVSHHAGLAFDGDSATFYSDFFSASGNQSVLYNDVYLSSGSVSSGCSFDRIVFQGMANLSGNLRANHVWMKQNGYLRDHPRIDTLVWTPGKTYSISSGDTLTVVDSLIAQGSCDSVIIVRATIPGQLATVRTTGSLTANFVSLKDVGAAGSLMANNAIDLGNNPNWLINPVPAQNLYWVGGSGLWNDRNHWNYTSGGPGGACIPTAYDNVFFDANSGFVNGSKTVTISMSATCANMDWSGAVANPSLAHASAGSLSIYGSLRLIPAMSFYSGPVYFEATSPGKTIFSAGHSFNFGPYFGQNNIGGGWTLLDSLWGNNIDLNSGALNTNGHKVIADRFSVGFDATGLDLDTSLMKVDFWSVSHHAGLTFDGDSATFYSDFFSASGNQSVLYNDVYLSSGSVSSGCSFDRIVFIGIANLSGDLRANHVWMKQNGYLRDHPRIDTLVWTPGKTYSISSGDTLTVVDSLIAQGSCDSVIIVRATIPGQLATVRTTGSLTANFVSLKDVGAVGSLTANNAINLGNNPNWIINPVPTQNLYWVGGSGLWNDRNHWSYTSGGPGGACIPTAYDNVFFDANSGFVNGSKTVTISMSATCANMD